jgi:hypothetical protein
MQNPQVTFRNVDAIFQVPERLSEADMFGTLLLKNIPFNVIQS